MSSDGFQRRGSGWRSAGAVAAGLVTIVVGSTAVDGVMHATGVFPPMVRPMATPLWLLATGYRLAIQVAGAYLTARLAPSRPLRHGMILGAIGLALATAGAAATWSRGPEFGPKWYALGLVVSTLPCCWAGARIRAGARA